MNRSDRSRWLNASAFVLLAVVWFVTGGDSVVARYAIPALALVAAFFFSPLRPRPNNHVSQAEATQLISGAAVGAGSQPVVVYHRPGCSFCARLRLALGSKRSQAHWVDIWADDDAATYVRMVNDGNETVPTVVIDGVPHTNPDPSVVKAALV